MLMTGLRTSLPGGKVYKTEATRYGQHCYYLSTEINMNNFGLEGKESYLLGCGIEQSMMNIVTLVRNYAESKGK